MSQIPLLAVVGPTASGKTALGIKLAQHLQSEIISIDSMQVYRTMDIGTAKPTQKEQAQATHHMIDIRNPDEPINAGDYREIASKIIATLHEQKKIPVLVGGTGLYMRALTGGLIETPEIPGDIHEEVWNAFREQGLKTCYERLSVLDQDAANQLHPNDSTRILRALEVRLATGKSIKSFQKQHQFNHSPYKVTYLAIDWDRQILYDRINQRVLLMVEEGLIEETETLLNKGFSPDLAALKSIGYLQAVQFLQGKMSKDQMIADIQQKTRRYAKKQLTWNRRNEEINLIPPEYTDADWKKHLG